MSENKQVHGRNKKPWYRLRNIIVVFLIAIVSWPTYIVIWALNVEPNPSVDYALQIQKLSIDSQPEGENGWPLLMDAISILKQIEKSLLKEGEYIDYFSELDFDIIYETDADESELAKLHIALEQMKSKGAIDRLARAAEYPNTVRPLLKSDEGPLLFALLPEIRDLRLLAKARLASMHIAINEGNLRQAIDAFDQTLYSAKSLTYQPSLVEQLVGMQIAIEANKRLCNAISNHNIDSNSLSSFRDILRNNLPLGPLSMGIEDNRLLAYDTIQHTFSDNGKGNGRVLFSQFDELGFMNRVSISNPSWQPFGGRESFPNIYNVTSIAYADRKETTAIIDRFFDGYIKQAKMTRKQRLANPFDYSEFMQLGWRHPVVGFLLFDLSRVFDKRDGVDCQIAGTILMLAIEEYHASNGQYPITLDFLIPEFLPEIPKDPFSEQGFIYHLITNADEQLNYVLYSVGADGIDNNGKMAEEYEDDAFSTSEGQGLDFSFNQTNQKEN